MPELNPGFCTCAVPLSYTCTRLEYFYAGGNFKAKDCTVEGRANGSGRKVLVLQTGGLELEDQHPREIHGTHL